MMKICFWSEKSVCAALECCRFFPCSFGYLFPRRGYLRVLKYFIDWKVTSITGPMQKVYTQETGSLDPHWHYKMKLVVTAQLNLNWSWSLT